MMRFAEWVIRNYKMLLVVVGSFAIAMFFFIGRNQVTERWNEYFDETYELRQLMEKANVNYEWRAPLPVHRAQQRR